MPRANPDYAGITKAAQAISRAEVQDLDADPDQDSGEAARHHRALRDQGPRRQPEPHGGGVMIVNNRTELEALPDGTIITWLRIPGDKTSEAVAFVRHEVDYDTPTAHGGPTRTTWVSPGGWHPMSPEEAGISYPCVAFTDPSQLPVTEWSPPEVMTLERGGTWSREKALECASRALAASATDWNPTNHGQNILALAETFDDWLTHDPMADALNQMATEGQMTLGDMAKTLFGWKAKGITRASTYYAVEQVWPYTEEAEPVNHTSDIEWESDGRTRSMQYELRKVLTDLSMDYHPRITAALAILDRYTSATREKGQ